VKSLSVRGVRIDRMAGTPVVVLREDESPRRQFEIYIGAPEAALIKIALDGESTPRPLTHELLVNTLEQLSFALTRVVLTHVSAGTYFAELVVVGEEGDETRVSARPSDAIALALRASCPIFASEALLEMVGEVVEEEEAAPNDEILDEFRDFIENISPEDFQ
jgi:bifunctional DNase/RNase